MEISTALWANVAWDGLYVFLRLNIKNTFRLGLTKDDR